MNDLERRIKELEIELSRARLEAEFAYDRENILRNTHDKLFMMFQELSNATEIEKKYAIIIKALKNIIDFEQVALLSRNLEENSNINVVYTSHSALARHKWEYKGEIAQALNDEIVVLNDPSIASGFESDDISFSQIARSVIMIPLILKDSQLLFVCTHSVPLTLNLYIKHELQSFKSLFAHVVMLIEYRNQLEEVVANRTTEIIDYQRILGSFRRLSNEGFWITDKDLNFINLDHKYFIFDRVLANTINYNNVIGKSFASLINEAYPDGGESIVNSLNELFKARAKVKDFELPILDNDKKVAWARINAEPYYDNDANFLGYRGTFLNITNEHLQTYQLQKAINDAEIANRSKSEYLAVMSHEIKTPLQAILGMLDLLEQTELDDLQRSYIKHVSQSASLLQTILHDVLDLSKIESSVMVLENISYDIRFTINSAVVQMKERAEAKGISLICNISDNFPQIIVGDQHRTSQILFNLINNAIKFTSKGSVTLTAERYENRLKFQVIDTGTGIPSEQLENLFKPFVQLDGSITRKYGGTGLGLAICKRLVEHMGGKIGIKSVLGEGSTFWFELPCKVPTTTLIGVNSIRKTVVHKERHYDILLVEDSQINQFVIKTMLEKLGHRVELASNGKEAIDKVKEKLPSLILMDLHMPVMDGIEATKYIMTKIAPLPIVALTANNSDEERIKCRKIGMVSMASKPVTTETLKKLLEDLEGVIEEANEKVAQGESFTLSKEAQETELDEFTPNTVATMGTVSSLGRSNAALIDALIKNQLSQPNKKDHQRIAVEEKDS